MSGHGPFASSTTSPSLLCFSRYALDLKEYTFRPNFNTLLQVFDDWHYIRISGLCALYRVIAHQRNGPRNMPTFAWLTTNLKQVTLDTEILWWISNMRNIHLSMSFYFLSSRSMFLRFSSCVRECSWNNRLYVTYLWPTEDWIEAYCTTIILRCATVKHSSCTILRHFAYSKHRGIIFLLEWILKIMKCLWMTDKTVREPLMQLKKYAYTMLLRLDQWTVSYIILGIPSAL